MEEIERLKREQEEIVYSLEKKSVLDRDRWGKGSRGFIMVKQKKLTTNNTVGSGGIRNDWYTVYLKPAPSIA